VDNKKLNDIENDIKTKQKDAVKEIIRLTFERLEELEKSRAAIQDQIKMFKHDLFDMKDGRIDRILERQMMSAPGTGMSLLSIEKKPNGTDNPWYVEYKVGFDCDGVKTEILINNSVTKQHAAGAYKLKDGTIKYL